MTEAQQATTTVPGPVLRLREFAHSAACAASVRAAALLGLPEALGDEPASPADLAAAVGADPDATARLLRSLAVHGVFTEDADGNYAHTPESRLLREDAPHSIKYNVLWATEPWTWELLQHLDEGVRTGKAVFPSLHGGEEFFSHLHSHTPRSAEVFDKAMTQSSHLSARAIAERLDLSGAGTVADIAGGQGLVLATLLEKHAGLHGTLLDLPNVVANPDPRLAAGGAFASRTRLLPGDCLQGIPVEADVYIFKNILEWDDESTVTALRNAVAAGRPGARVIVIENLVDGSPEMKFTTAMDLLLLLNVGGKKHTRKGLAALMEKAGLRVDRISAVNSYLHMFEAVIPG
ncbi:C-methyltransferase [Actinacidiphila yanglinensis]|uniref:C-methyltransferase n=1 Tax=Actinacidiphila yanglinensis TaxID=310779 RepID=A0A1H6E9F7_9ACTN|nr:methyltransferase [Actinacidiphila yanglinensis]SEG93576.1 C-methyltransferase [Actinacidiphila yanglinensis]